MKARATRLARRSSQGGSLLIEVVVSIFICAFGLLGFAGLQARATSAEFEAFQRTQAIQLVDDMASRINANRSHGADYVSAGLLGAGAVADCSALLSAARDVCEWSNLIRGSSETRAGSKVGSMLAARGCILRPSTTTDRYIISVAWLGMVPTAGPANPCGNGDPAFPLETLRRTASATVCVALLRDAASAPTLPRC